MELHDFLEILRRRWRIVVISIVASVGIAGAYSALVTPQYSAMTQVVVSTRLGADASTSDLLQGATYSRNQVKTYVQLVEQPLVLGPVIESMGLDMDVEQLAEKIAVSNPLDTTIIAITVTDADPEWAASIADAVADSFTNVIEEMETEPGSNESPVKVTTAAAATSPAAPSSPNVKLNLAFGLSAGLLIGIGVAIALELANTKVRGERDVERATEATVIGSIPDTTGARVSPLVVDGDHRGPRMEAYRRLRTNLQFVDASRRKSFVITSSLPGEGTTTTAINIATTMTEAGMRVCLVDGNLRKPRIASLLGMDGKAGLTSVLIGRANLSDVLHPWGGHPNLRVVPSGQIPPNPTELLGSELMARVVRSLEASFDAVVIDAPPLLPVIDAAVLAKMSGGAVVVVGAGKVHGDELTQALDSLEAVDAHVFGIVMTMVRAGRGESSHTYASGAHATK